MSELHTREANLVLREYVGCWLLRLTIWAVPEHGDERGVPVVMEKWIDQADLDDGDLGFAVEAIRRGLAQAETALYSP